MLETFEIKVIIDKNGRFPTDKYITFEVTTFSNQIDKLIDLIGEENIEYVEAL